jgi:hypothetical protein
LFPQSKASDTFANLIVVTTSAVHLRKFQFASEVLSQVVEAVLGVKRTPYSTILALDRKVRDHQALKIPPNGATGPAELGAATVALTLQRFLLKAAVEMS